MTTNSDILKKQMLDALEKSLGIITSACKQIGIARSTHYEWYSKDKRYRNAVKEIENIALDFAESQLHKQIMKGNPSSTIFYLKCKAKKRGYIEQQDIKVTGNMKFRADFGESNSIHSTSKSEDNT
jgi:hypothetical protein